MSHYTFKAERRTKPIKNISRKALAGNFIPAVIYNKKINIPITIDRHDFEKVMPQLRSNTIFDIVLDDEKLAVFTRECAYDVKSHRIEHLDLYKLEDDSTVTIRIPIELKGLALGITKGGLIRKHSTTLKIKAKTEHIPEKIELDISDMDIDDVIFVRDLLKKDAFKNAPYKVLSSSAQVLVSVTLSSRAASGSAAQEKKADDTKKPDSEPPAAKSPAEKS
ncbi:50S ribosomal protein L25 [Spirochaetota bacterium]|nr:50S ribosomal protein L25 [Spirochaetota bacterium]